MSAQKRNVLITGAGIGIGQAAARAFAALGDHVIVTDILEQEGEATAAAIRADGGSAEFLPYDVRSPTRADEIVADVEARLGPLDVIVANAGIAHRTPLYELTDEKWDLTFDIDLKAMFRLVRAAAPAMRARKSGSVVALSSIMGIAYGWDEHVHYSAAKAGVIGLVRALAVEMARDGVRVNGVAPGYIRTAQLLSEENSLGPVEAEKAAAFIPMGRLGDPSDIADVITFLASQAARYMTGQVVVVDGGLLVGRY
ncbi:SDR family NAD(P)-dependent oxidoreductase [Rhizobium paknamense]|uniref:3-oxoacyl-[acyl-carrier protein] reductase n=1 Tax=Rhizobium paknamense TaxID=1206817 RepID=A0ABU0IID5_9HYPH|nr:SDR family NAD(P)-dependent oxidoreductase [Rhizobium paknamense]MDQ0458028.1 3-oxoacyl-[acyl-carrier protein] reductase [Rhizobium paknamense]